MTFESNKQFNENQLLIIYVLKEFDRPLPASDFELFMLSPRVMTYFAFREALANVIDAEMISESKDSEGAVYYAVSEKGKRAADSLCASLPKALLDQYNSVIKNKGKIMETLDINASYFTDDDNMFFCRCFIRDKDKYLADIRIPASDRDEAIAICENWKKNNSATYLAVLKAMIPS